MRLKDKIAIVTGSSRGIGAAIASEYAKEGARVVITYKTEREKALELADRIGSELVIQLDVVSRASIKAMFEKVWDRYNGIDILVNNAGVNRPGNFDKITDEDWDVVLDTDLKGVFMCCQEVLPYISDNGRILNIGSVSGEFGGPRTPSYAAAKAGVMALTHCLARFVAHRGICVNCLSPGYIESEFADRAMPQKFKDEVLQCIPLGRFGTIKELVGAAVFLASEESSYMTAQTISLNGGIWVR